jgi:hypothetical protein
MNMKDRRLIYILALCVCLSTSFAYVMGPDDRVEISNEQASLTAVRQTGMISIQGEEFVSGLVTGENCDVVITAGHAAIYWQSVSRKGWRKGEVRGQGKFRFSLDPKSGPDWQAMTLVNSGYEQADDVGKDEHDWSIFRLSTPALPQCENVSVMRDKRECQGGLLMPGFHFDRPNTKLIDQSCSVKSVSGDGIIVHDCDSKDGSSGAPLFCHHDGSSALLAINISGLTRKDYFDAGVYGKSGSTFHNRQHKNFAVFIGGDFYKALMRELKASAGRRKSGL